MEETDRCRKYVEAMRTPTLAMIEAGQAQMTWPHISRIYPAMIDAALSHDEVKGQPDDVMARFRRGETITLADLIRDLEDDPPS